VVSHEKQPDGAIPPIGARIAMAVILSNIANPSLAPTISSLIFSL